EFQNNLRITMKQAHDLVLESPFQHAVQSIQQVTDELMDMARWGWGSDFGVVRSFTSPFWVGTFNCVFGITSFRRGLDGLPTTTPDAGMQVKLTLHAPQTHSEAAAVTRFDVEEDGEGEEGDSSLMAKDDGNDNATAATTATDDKAPSVYQLNSTLRGILR
ncbi:hypothetical protein H0H93_003293, partial [Arthromyces matolae]